MRLLRTKRMRFLVGLTVFAAAGWISGIRLFAFPGKSMSPTVSAGDHFVGMVGLPRRLYARTIRSCEPPAEPGLSRAAEPVISCEM